MTARHIVALRWLAATLFIVAGVSHFFATDLLASTVPPSFPAPRLLVQISGVAEIVGGVGLLVPALRRAAGWGLILLLIAVFPAHIQTATHPQNYAHLGLPTWVFWVRMPFQLLFIAWVWYVSLRHPLTPPTPSSRS